MRITTPWVEALKLKRPNEETSSPPSPATTSAKPIQLAPKRMSDSFTRVLLPLAEDPWLLDKYLNAAGDVRLGTILMDLDAFSGVVAIKHAGNTSMTVTAAIDRIIIQNPLTEIQNLEYSGRVTFATGRSSVEVSLQVAKAPKDGEDQKPEDVLMTCAFTMVSLDPKTKQPMNVPALKVDTPEEERLFALGERNYNAKKATRNADLQRKAPNGEEAAMIHSMWMARSQWYDTNEPASSKPADTVFMDETRISSTQIMQPAYRNRHHFMIFGGYLMQQTYELAFTCAAAFSHTRPTFVSLDPSQFKNPVPVGSVLYLTATIAYTEEAAPGDGKADGQDENYTRVQVRVDSSVRNIEHGEKKPTGQFNYTFVVRKDVKVMPRTYQEFMFWTDARRRAQQNREFFESIGSSAKSGGDDGKAERRTE